jgi:hypothetical protein
MDTTIVNGATLRWLEKDAVADSYFMEMELILNDSYFTKANVDKSF